MARERLDQDFVSEKDLLEALGLEQPVLERLIYKEGFPYIRLARGTRVYYEPSVVEWLKAHEIKKQDTPDQAGEGGNDD